MFEKFIFLDKKYAEVVVVIDVEIYDCGDLVIRNIGEELIRENHKNINFYFISEMGLGESGYTIVSDKNKEVLSKSKTIVLTENKEEGGIFLYQAKAKIKAEILKIVGQEETNAKMEIIAVVSPYNMLSATVLNHFIAKELGSDDNKVCMLSFNIDFPFNYIGWNIGNKGLLKSLYYYNNQENFNPGIISQNANDQYHYIEMDIKGNEIDEITNIFINHLIKFLETQNYRYLVLDYGVLYWRVKEIADYLYYILIEDGGLNLEMDKIHIDNMKNSGVEVIELGLLDKIISIKNGLIKFNKDREELILWKRRLRKKLLKN